MNKANINDIKILKETIEKSQNEDKFKRVWFNDLETLVQNNNIERIYEVTERGFMCAIGYVITKDNQVLILRHDTNNVNTAYGLTSFYVKHENIRSNFYELFNDEMLG